MGFRVRNAQEALAHALSQGANAVTERTLFGDAVPAIEGIGGSLIYLVDDAAAAQLFADGFETFEGDFEGAGLRILDHLTHNVRKGRMDFFAEFYGKIFGFREIRYFDIKGEYTGLTSRALTGPCGKLRIPINESAGGDKLDQIAEFIEQYKGEGIQHIALATDDIIATYDMLKANGVSFMTPPPETYYEMLAERLPGHGEPTDELKRRGILLDGNGEGRLLLQIFTETCIGPIFFEIIQRKGDEGFGEGNFKALFESMERDQLRRGVLKIDEPA
jgi:4-hydroxyphenylpyruvate dioxygenase